jgi:ADP-heptose:LPS heptosyltransferase
MNILILRYSSIGDIVLTSPVVRCLRKSFPEAEIAFATKTTFRNLVAYNPYLSRFFLLDRDFQHHLSELKAFKPDLIVDLHHNLRTARIKTALRCRSCSFDKLNLEKWLLVNFKWNLMPYRHVVDRYMQTLSGEGVVYDGQGLDFFFPDPYDDGPVNALLPPQNTFTAYAVGGQYGTKKLPADLMRNVLQDMSEPVVLLGDKKDATTIQEAVQDLPGVTNLCGRLDLFGSAAVLRAARRVISHDSGLMHISAALKKPIASLWGNTVPEFGMTPFYPTGISLPSTILEVKDLPCRPCSKIGFETCPRGHFACMRNLDLSALTEA